MVNYADFQPPRRHGDGHGDGHGHGQEHVHRFATPPINKIYLSNS